MKIVELKTGSKVTVLVWNLPKQFFLFFKKKGYFEKSYHVWEPNKNRL